MKSDIRKCYETRAAVMKAMGHPTRLFIVDELAAGPRCVCELTEMIGDDISTVSKHLSVLRNVGIVADDRQGSKIFYSLRTKCATAFFTCVEGVLGNQGKDGDE